MSVDHARSFFHRSHPAELWGSGFPQYDGDHFLFFVRLITHFCAPGFFLLMGASMVFNASRFDNIPYKHFLTRGFVLILLQLFVVNIAWLYGHASSEIARETYGLIAKPGVPNATYIYIGVLASLGFSMIVSMFFLRSSFVVLLSLVLLLQIPVIYWVFTSNPADYISPVVNVLGLPGQSGFMSTNYPVLPWLSITLLGIIYGRLMMANTVKNLNLKLSVVFLSVFVFLKLLGIASYNEAGSGVIGFFSITKYPPSLLYQSLTLGVVFLFIACFNAVPDRVSLYRIMVRFGQGTLFFYVVHLFLLGSIAWMYPLGIGWIQTFVSLGLALPFLYLGCLWWANQKKRRPKQHWIHLL